MAGAQDACDLCETAVNDDDIPLQEPFRLTIDIKATLVNKPLTKEDKKIRKTAREDKIEELTKKVSALRNAGGGALLVHLQGLSPNDRCLALFNEYVDDTLTKLIEDGVLFVDTYTKIWLSEHTTSEGYQEYLLLIVKSSPSLTTADFKTKVKESVCTMAGVAYMKEPRHTEVVVSWPSNSPLLPRVRLQEELFEAIQTHVLTSGKLSVYPPKTARTMSDILYQRIQTHGKHFEGGLSFVTRSLAVVLNFPKVYIPDGVISEVFYVLPDRPSMILCFVCEKRDDLGKYVLRLARRAINQIRKYTDEHFSAVYGLLDPGDLESDNLFADALRSIEDKTSALCSLHALSMNSVKCMNIIRAFLAAVAVTDLTEGDSMKPELRLLSKQHFCKLVENIDEDRVVIDKATIPEAEILMIEVARRLEKRGQTILLVQEDLKKKLQEQHADIVSHILASDELEDVSRDNYPNIQHIVADNMKMNDIKKLQLDDERSGKTVIWLFHNSEELSFSGETSTYESADDMSRSRNEDGYWSGVTESDDDDMEAIQSSDDAREAGEIQLQDKSRDDSLRDCAEQTIKESISGTASSPLLPHVTKCLKEHFCTTIIGQPGDGKTTLAFQVLSEMHRKKWKVYIVETPQDYFRIQKSDRYIILFSNIFGNPNFQFDHYRKWHPVLLDVSQEQVASASRCQVVYTIFLFRKNVFQTALKYITPFKNTIFSERQRIDFEKIYKAEGKITLDTDRTADKTSNDHVTDCSKTTSPLLHKLCMMITLRHEVFNTQAMDRESRFRHILNNLMVNEGILSTLQICIHQNCIPHPAELSNLQLRRLCTGAGASPLRSKQLTEALTQMDRYILKKSAHGFVFSHSWTSEVVAKVLAEHDETTFIVHCSLKYLEYVRFEPNEVAEFDYAIIVPQKSATVLAQRLREELLKGHLQFVMSHMSLTHPVVCDAIQTLLQRENFKMRDAHSKKQILSFIPICNIPSLELKLLEVASGGISTMQCLRMCSRYGNVRLMRLLIEKIEKNAPMLQQKRYNVGELFRTCAKWNHAEGCEVLLKYVDVNCIGKRGNTALHYAASSDNLELLSLLLNQDDIDVDVLNKKGETALAMALYCKHEQVAETLIQARANTLLKDKYGRTSFLIAALVGSVSILELLLISDHRCIYHCDAFGNTALHLAAIKGQTEVIKLLLKEGLDIQKGNMDRMTPLHIAATNGRYSVVDPLLSIERNSATSREDGKRFVRGVSVDLKDIHGMAPIHYAAIWGYEYVLGRLLQNKSEVNLMTEKSETALHLATQGGHIEAVQSLLKNKADANLSDWKGRTPLHIAAEEGHLKIVKLFLREKVDTQKVDEDNKTARELAFANKHRSIVKEISKVRKKRTEETELSQYKLDSWLDRRSSRSKVQNTVNFVPFVIAIILMVLSCFFSTIIT
ncbi:uncharacterized protein LOC124266254 isoform X2 [Haliotis rubra]|uniref:uncharacterized protein LOC124266254 isoform X2 n=1 Tax=Haliotis rubra TaxID=36100 RepID=UPI001EE60895|nr:uncharacterized protein LOC124266254 isoform X2 [Haliotis rubra]